MNQFCKYVVCLSVVFIPGILFVACNNPTTLQLEQQLGYTPTPSDLRSAEEMELIEPTEPPFPEFPHTTELPEGVKSVSFTDKKVYGVDIFTDVVYDKRDDVERVLQILVPVQRMGMKPIGDSPLIVYVPGSAWFDQGRFVYQHIANLIRFAEQGYVVAIVQYRGTEIAPFPAQIEDAKTAIRFMRKNAEAYKIDTDRVAIFGDSSGGHTAVMVGITGDEMLDNGTYNEFSSAVNVIVNWFGPSDISLMSYYPNALLSYGHFFPGATSNAHPKSPPGRLIGGLNVLENPEKAQATNPINYITKEVKLPPMLIMHGSRDDLVPFNQSVRLYERMREMEQTVEMYKLENAGHPTGGFHSNEAFDLVLEFIGQHLM